MCSACSSPSFITSESQGYLSLAFPFPPVSNHAVGVFGFKALERELADGLQPFPFPFLPPASDLAAEKIFHLTLRSVRPALAKSKAACLYVCERGIQEQNRRAVRHNPCREHFTCPVLGGKRKTATETVIVARSWLAALLRCRLGTTAAMPGVERRSRSGP